MNRLKNMIIPILSILCVLSIIVMLFAISNAPKNEVEFAPPNFEVEAIQGLPKPPQELGWSELYQDGMNYRVGICGNIVAYNNVADIYLSNSSDNKVWLKLRVLDENNNIIGETGLLKPNEYVKSVKLVANVQNGQRIKLKIMSYEPETYYSQGSVVLNTNIKIGD